MENSDKVKKIVREINEFLSNMSEEERRIFFIEMGFKMTEEEKSIINEPAKYLREAAYTGKQFQPGPLHKKTVIEDSKTTDANHDLTAISEAIDKCQVAAELESTANPTIYSGNNEQPQNNMEENDIASANKIINELDEKLSKMSDKERKEYFKKMGLIFEEKPTEKVERHKQLIRLKAALAALYVLNEKSVAEDEKLSAELREFLRELDELQKRPRPKQNIITVNLPAGVEATMRDWRRTVSADIQRWTEEINAIESEALCQYNANKGPKL